MSLSPPLTIAHITDTHLFAEPDKSLFGFNTAQSLQAIIARLQQLYPKPSYLLLTGDLAQDETPKAYERLRDSLQPLGIPAYWLPGNHDRPELMQQILASPPMSANKSFAASGWNFLLLNTRIPDGVSGRLSPESLNWLEAQLQAHPHQLATIALHHHPLPIGAPWMDKIALENAEDFFAIIDRHPQVRLVLCGHIHQEFDSCRGNVRYLGTPSTCAQFKPHTPDFAIDDSNPGFRLLKFYADGTFTSWIERVQVSGYVPYSDRQLT